MLSVFRTTAVLIAAACATPALAQTTNHPADVNIAGTLAVGVEPNGDLWVADDATIDGSICIGNSCSNAPGGEVFANDETMRFQYTQLSIQFNDTSSSTSPNNDWTLRVNDPNSRASGGIDRFSIEDDTSGTTPFTIAAGVPDNAFWLASSGLGLGTSLPTASMHIVGSDPRILIEQSGTTAVREMFNMTNNGGSYFTLDNTDSGTTWYFVHENASPNRFIITDGVADGPEMTLTADGDITIPGNFISGATTLNVPDYVFADAYPLRPLSEVAEFVSANRHLPDVPSAADIAKDGLDLTDMQMTLLKKVEELTLYTLEQQDRIAAQDAQIAELRGLVEQLVQTR
ncbi:hypothetical protein [Primorskyibacter sp. 2E233]|uniref:hypothetical protein n=1 Tax=Primorskyibacter sp. 2E233 TaxID=3413431 RepID=UPI003BF36485